jgi:hypothetical protein
VGDEEIGVSAIEDNDFDLVVVFKSLDQHLKASDHFRIEQIDWWMVKCHTPVARITPLNEERHFRVALIVTKFLCRRRYWIVKSIHDVSLR